MANIVSKTVTIDEFQNLGWNTKMARVQVRILVMNTRVWDRAIVIVSIRTNIKHLSPYTWSTSRAWTIASGPAKGSAGAPGPDRISKYPSSSSHGSCRLPHIILTKIPPKDDQEAELSEWTAEAWGWPEVHCHSYQGSVSSICWFWACWQPWSLRRRRWILRYVQRHPHNPPHSLVETASYGSNCRHEIFRCVHTSPRVHWFHITIPHWDGPRGVGAQPLVPLSKHMKNVVWDELQAMLDMGVIEDPHSNGAALWFWCLKSTGWSVSVWTLEKSRWCLNLIIANAF